MLTSQRYKDVIMIIWIMFMLGGCALLPPATATVSPSSEPQPPPTAAPTATPTATPAPQITTLRLWLPDFLDPYNETTGAAVLNDQLLSFSEIYPDVQVQVIVKKATGEGGLFNLLSTAYYAAPDVLPDVIALNQADLHAAINGGFVQSLEMVAFEPDEFFPFALQDIRQEDIYGIPFVASADQMAYRRGIAVSTPFSWTDVLTSGYSLLFPAAPVDELADDALLAMYLGTGGTVMDEQGKAKLDRPNLEQVYGFFVDLLSRNLINPDRALALENAAMCWETYQQGIGRLSPVPMALYWADPPQGSAPGWVPTPDGQPLTIARVWSLALVAQDPFRQESAMQLALWLTSPSQMGTLTQATLLLPPRGQAFEQWALLPEEAAFLNELLQNAVPELSASVNKNVRQALQAGLRVLLEREVTTPEEAASYALNNLR